MLKIILLSLAMAGGLATICVNVTKGYQTYDLSYLSNLTGPDGYKVSLCQSYNCLETTNYLYTTFISRIEGENCVALTSNPKFIQPEASCPSKISQRPMMDCN